MENYTEESTRKFLELYKRLEYLENVEPERFAQIKKSNYQIFDTFRHIRNCLTHTPKTLSDGYIFHISNEILEYLEHFVNQLVTKAIDEGTRVGQIRVARPTDDAKNTIILMDRLNYSNLPVLDDKGVVRYVVSNRAILRALAHNYENNELEDEYYSIEDLKEYFDLDANKDIYYEFMSKDTYAYDAKMKFIGYNKDHKRCALIFITETGNKNEPIIGLVSPRDVLDI